MEMNGSRSGEIFDISQLRPERRTDVWTDALYEKYYPLDVDFPGPLFAAGRLAIKDLMDIRVGRVQSDPFIVHRRRSHLSQRTGDYYLVLIPARRPLRLRQRGQEALVAPGDAVVVGTTETHCYEQRTHNDVLTLRIPGPLLRERIGDIDDCTARCLPMAQPSVALFVDFARSLSLHGSELERGDAKISVRALLDLLAIATFALERAGAGGETSVRIAHRRRALKLIDAKLGDHALNPSLVARTLGFVRPVSSTDLCRPRPKFILDHTRPPNRRSQAVVVERRLAPSQHFLNRLRCWLRRSGAFQPGFSDRDRYVSTGLSRAIAVRLRPSTVNRRSLRRHARLVYGAAEVNRALVPIFVRFSPRRPAHGLRSNPLRYVAGVQPVPSCRFGGSISNALVLAARPSDAGSVQILDTMGARNF
jgi:hypothetical protein